MQTATSRRKPGSGKFLSRPAVAQQPAQLTPQEVAAQDHARAEVDQLLRLHGIKSKPHFDDVAPGEDKTIYVNVPFATANRDHQVVLAILEQQGWTLDPSRLSRSQVHIDTMRVRHKATHARLTVIVRIPTGDSLRPTPEAA